MLEALALLVIAIGAVEAAIGIVLAIVRPEKRKARLWLEFARWLVAGLIFQLAADIVHTTVAPSWVQSAGLPPSPRSGRSSLFLDRDIEFEYREQERAMQGAPDATALIGFGRFSRCSSSRSGRSTSSARSRSSRGRRTRRRCGRSVHVVLAAIAVVAGGLAGQWLEYWGISSSAMLLRAASSCARRPESGARAVSAGASAPPALPAVPMAAAMWIISRLSPLWYRRAHRRPRQQPRPRAHRRHSRALLAVMVLNLLTMLYGRRIMGGVTVMVLRSSARCYVCSRSRSRST